MFLTKYLRLKRHVTLNPTLRYQTPDHVDVFDPHSCQLSTLESLDLGMITSLGHAKPVKALLPQLIQFDQHDVFRERF